jgi:hypothetical protein
VAIAIENATLYRSLQRKVQEYERLKEFSENIVESINVGILAADLEDRVESWNTQMEHLIPRDSPAGCDLPAACESSAARGNSAHHMTRAACGPGAKQGIPDNGNGKAAARTEP